MERNNGGFKMKVELGCGKNKKEGYIGIDCMRFNGVDYIGDIDKETLPFGDNSVDEIYSHMTLEHCTNIVFIMNEIHRVCKAGAIVKIIVPYGSSHQFVQDPTHKTQFNEDTFRKYFCNEEYVKTFSDYGITGFFKEKDIHIEGKDILHLHLYAELEVIKNG